MDAGGCLWGFIQLSLGSAQRELTGDTISTVVTRFKRTQFTQLLDILNLFLNFSISLLVLRSTRYTKLLDLINQNPEFPTLIKSSNHCILLGLLDEGRVFYGISMQLRMFFTLI